MNRAFQNSLAYLERAEAVIPAGTGTFSKCANWTYPLGVAPLYVKEGHGAYITDVDNNIFIDCVNALTAVTLGHNDLKVNRAVDKAMQVGILHSLPHIIEAEVAEMICEMVPCAEMVRFGKNGSDATAGAIRLARAYTGRDHIAQHGYHGWQDWYIGVSGRNLGVPQAVRDLTHTFKYNDLQSLQDLFDRYPNQIAAVIMEPMNREYPRDNFLQLCKELAHQNGALFIMDETITGFRFANGGASEFFKVVPDIATFGKGIANGFPLSAIAGRRDIMTMMERIHFSFTYSGEIYSLFAAQATLKRLMEEPICKEIAQQGMKIQKEFRPYLNGHPSWMHQDFSSPEQKTLYIQEMARNKVLSIGTINMQHCIQDLEVNMICEALKHTYRVMSDAKGHELEYLACEPLKAGYKIR